MCGIAGLKNVTGKQKDLRATLQSMLAAISHRGPDEAGLYMDDIVGLGNVRLSIIGIRDGTQPLSNEDGSLWIVYNGETFNYMELKRLLLEDGHRFRTQTDTEVVLHLYERYGPRCLQMMNGQFAFAIWNTQKKTLFLARDRLGIRPLFYCNVGGTFMFASEIKALFAVPKVHREIDLRALKQVLTLWATITPDTLFKNVFSLPPGHYMTVESGKVAIQSYWNIPCYPASEQLWSSSFAEAQSKLQWLIRDAVRIRLTADVPVGAYLSGGLDSAVIAATVAKHYNRDLKTFSLNFHDPAFDESRYQALLVNELGTRHQYRLIGNHDIAQYLPDVVWHCEAPLLRTAPVPLFLLSQETQKQNYKVVLTGEGADELFCGYNLFKEAKIRAFCSRRPESSRRPMLFGRLYPYIFNEPRKTHQLLSSFFNSGNGNISDPLFSHTIRWKNGSRLLRFISREVQEQLATYDPVEQLHNRLPKSFQKCDLLSRAQLIEMDIFLANYLLSSQGDRVALAHGLEIRLPFLDHRLVEFAFGLPPQWKILGLNEKYILKKAANHLVPPAIVSRSKQPYRAPIHTAFFNKNRIGYAEELLSKTSLSRAGYFNAEMVDKLMQRFRTFGASALNEMQNMAFIGILTTQLLHQQFIDGWPGKTISPLNNVKATDRRKQ